MKGPTQPQLVALRRMFNGWHPVPKGGNKRTTIALARQGWIVWIVDKWVLTEAGRELAKT